MNIIIDASIAEPRLKQITADVARHFRPEVNTVPHRHTRDEIAPKEQARTCLYSLAHLLQNFRIAPAAHRFHWDQKELTKC